MCISLAKAENHTISTTVDYRLKDIKKGRVISDPASFFGIKVSLFLNFSPEPPKTEQGRAEKKHGGKFGSSNEG